MGVKEAATQRYQNKRNRGLCIFMSYSKNTVLKRLEASFPHCYFCEIPFISLLLYFSLSCFYQGIFALLVTHLASQITHSPLAQLLHHLQEVVCVRVSGLWNFFDILSFVAFWEHRPCNGQVIKTFLVTHTYMHAQWMWWSQKQETKKQIQTYRQ